MGQGVRGLTLPWVKSVTAHMQETERSGRGSATGQDDAAHMPSSLCRTWWSAASSPGGGGSTVIAEHVPSTTFLHHGSSRSCTAATTLGLTASSCTAALSPSALPAFLDVSERA